MYLVKGKWDNLRITSQFSFPRSDLKFSISDIILYYKHKNSHQLWIKNWNCKFIPHAGNYPHHQTKFSNGEKTGAKHT